jgi:tRNA pseudouridine55 synthase
MGRRRKGLPVSGWVILDKPVGLGSTKAVARVRRAFGAQKAGHAGTLDPLATGILPVALGEATKTVGYLVDGDKSYHFTIAWGASTASFDADGAVTETSEVRPSASAVAAALGDFVGEIAQVPPAFSAVKIGGERAYDLARAGVVPDLQPRTVVIHEARVLGAPDADHVILEIVCGKGTYVRSLARDLAASLGACGHVSALRRTRVGPFGASDAVTLEQLEDLCDRGRGLEALAPVETALDDIPALAVTDEEAFRLSQGRPIVLLPRQVETLKARLTSPDGAGFASRTVLAMRASGPAAICEMRAGQLRPVRVFNL